MLTDKTSFVLKHYSLKKPFTYKLLLYLLYNKKSDYCRNIRKQREAKQKYLLSHH